MRHPAINNPLSTSARALLAALCLVCAAGCNNKPQPVDDQPIRLPGYGTDGQARPDGVYASIRRADLPLNQPTDSAWQAVREEVLPTLQRGAWRGNGLRLGILKRDQLEAFAKAMPRPLAFGEFYMNKSDYLVPILETSRLSTDVGFQIGLTRPPRPLHVEDVVGGKNSTLRMLAKIEDGPDGEQVLVLTPHHYIPSRLNLIPRNPLDKELDGRIFEELSIRLPLDNDQIAVVGMYWPWPAVQEQAEAAPGSAANKTDATQDRDTPPADAADPPPAPADDDPAAPPRHTQPPPDVVEQADRPEADRAPGPAVAENQAERIAPPLPNNFGSNLFTGTRIRKPIHTVLLITIQTPQKPPQKPVDENPGGPTQQ